jgi:hypothetical protein
MCSGAVVSTAAEIEPAHERESRGMTSTNLARSAGTARQTGASCSRPRGRLEQDGRPLEIVRFLLGADPTTRQTARVICRI